MNILRYVWHNLRVIPAIISGKIHGRPARYNKES